MFRVVDSGWMLLSRPSEIMIQHQPPTRKDETMKTTEIKFLDELIKCLSHSNDKIKWAFCHSKRRNEMSTTISITPEDLSKLLASVSQRGSVGLSYASEMVREESDFPLFKTGDCVFVRTVTNYFVGRVKKWKDAWILLEDVSWVADTGRFSDALRKGEFSEIELYPDDVFVSVGSIVDVSRWNHSLPKENK